MKTLLIFFFTLLSIFLIDCSSIKYINHPLVVHYENGTMDTCYFEIKRKHHFEILEDEHFNMKWLVIVPDGYDITKEMWGDKRVWLKRNVVRYELID